VASTERLGAVHEDLVGTDDDRRDRPPKFVVPPVEHVRIGDNPGRAIQAQRLVLAGDEHEQARPPGADHPAEAVDQVVAVQVGNGDVVVVEDPHEAGWPTPR